MKRQIGFIIALALAACGTSNQATKGSGAKGSAAQGANQKAGGTAEGDMSMATSDTSEYEGVTCDASDEGLAWCDDDSTIVFCSGGSFWSLDCAAVGGDSCGELDDTVDCYLVQ